MWLEVEAAGKSTGCRSILEAPGDCQHSLPRSLRAGKLQHKKVEQDQSHERALVQRVREAAEEDRWMMGLASQGQWIPQELVLKRSLDRKEFWSTDQGKLTLQAMADLLPNPKIVKILGKEESSSFVLYGAPMCTDLDRMSISTV